MRKLIFLFLLIRLDVSAQQHSSNGMSSLKLAGLHCETAQAFQPCDEWPTGLAWDGQYLWTDGSQGMCIYKYSTAGKLLDSIPNPSKDHGAEGMVFEGSKLWVLVEQEDMLYQLDASNGRIIKKFEVDLGTDGFGLTIVNDKLYATNYTQGKLVEINRADGHIERSIMLDRKIMSTVCINSHLFGIDYGYHNLYEVDIASGKCVDSIPWCINYPLGLAWDGTWLWNVSSSKEYGGDQMIYKMKIKFPGTTVAMPVPLHLDISVSNDSLMINSENTLSGCVFFILMSDRTMLWDGLLAHGVTYIDIHSLSPGDYILKIGELEKPFVVTGPRQ